VSMQLMDGSRTMSIPSRLHGRLTMLVCRSPFALCLLIHIPLDGDYAVSVLARLLGKVEDSQFFWNRSMLAPRVLFNNATGFMEARNASGAWAGPDNGWTEGDKWAYSFDVVHAIDEAIALHGGKAKFVRSLDEHFDGGEYFRLLVETYLIAFRS
jgi:putative alpha-1,2-mannosidase